MNRKNQEVLLQFMREKWGKIRELPPEKTTIPQSKPKKEAMYPFKTAADREAEFQAEVQKRIIAIEAAKEASRKAKKGKKKKKYSPQPKKYNIKNVPPELKYSARYANSSDSNTSAKFREDNKRRVSTRMNNLQTWKNDCKSESLHTYSGGDVRPK